jgi:hypothetical protein
MIFNKTATLLLLATCAFLVSCEKNELHTSALHPVGENESRVKVVNLSFYQKNPGYQISLNGERVSNLLSSTGTSPNPTPFPGGGLATGGGNAPDYMLVPAQQNTIKLVIPKRNTNIDSAEMATSSFTYESGKKYTLYFTDTAANTQAILVVDSLQRPDSGFTRYKFVNMMPDQPSLDLYINSTKVASAVPYKGASAAFNVPTNTTPLTWAVRVAGGTTNLFTQTIAGSIPNQRVLTIMARGYNSITTSTDPRRRALNLITTD